MKILKLASVSFLGMGLILSSNANVAKASSQEKPSYSLKKANTFFTKKLTEKSDTEDLVKTLKSAEESDEVMELPNDEKLILLENILDTAPEDAVKQYKQEKAEEINTILSSEVTVDNSTKNVELSDGSSVSLGSTDESEDNSDNLSNDNSGLISTFSATQAPFVLETKKYGNRRYTAWVKLKSLGVTIATLKLVNHYSVGDYGLKMRSADVAGTNGTALSSVDASAEVTDKKAEKKGYDINAVGTYKLTGSVNNGYSTITSKITLDGLNKTKKYARVYQEFKWKN